VKAPEVTPFIGTPTVTFFTIVLDDTIFTNDLS
jgi:hypothetical protein